MPTHFPDNPGSPLGMPINTAHASSLPLIAVGIGTGTFIVLANVGGLGSAEHVSVYRHILGVVRQGRPVGNRFCAGPRHLELPPRALDGRKLWNAKIVESRAMSRTTRTPVC